MLTVLKRGLTSCLNTPIHRLNSPQTDVTLLCWVQSVRKHKNIFFVDLSDGLSSHRLQAVIPADKLDPQGIPLSVGCSLRINGDLVPSPGKNQKLELVTKQFSVLGKCDLSDYPFRPRNKYNVDFERGLQHLRPRLEKYAAVHRVRNKLIHAMHSYFQDLEFCQVQTPILTTNDCEGAGETFLVHHVDDLKQVPASQVTPQSIPDNTENENRGLRMQPTYFPSQCHLTVSSQLHLEALMHSISRVYTIQTAFRAENASSRKHLCEFAMLEAELVIESVDGLIDLIEGLINRAWQEVCQMGEFKTVGEEWRDTVDAVLKNRFIRMTYDDALEELKVLLILSVLDKKFQHPLKWGEDFKVEHENALLDIYAERPIVVTHFPSIIKPFYMLERDGTYGPVAECFDLLLPIGGEAVGGSMRETDRTKLLEVIEKAGLKGLEWYVQLREFGTIPHGGFGLGVDRLLQYFTNTHNIKDAVPFPRWQRHCQA
ncbi:uncharacterized protein LOC111267230 isoform X3 [Varroa jacobsoni]|uniref:uncharacterized protein LOC111267230 isoform X3 n=1 Tax=Varroa jacobsoni TaxID=62625 RepID=UPI000BF56199|nr:uncharacterized protein LOC111267230 isoform X3 [Varroa jacobsoni]